ncbi:hypothetical protein [Absidia glauca]|uniref:Uncharacterized protein n=1 Tax=Absidia glauca TaxID=4829 RepID=A0A163IVQ3_ABSGL|nr:hypothetical protein [Absidia glauca]
MDCRTLRAPNLPGSDLLSKQICKTKWVMDIILKMALGTATSDYFCANTYFPNGMICDILLEPKNDDGCPVLVEIQNVVSSTWLTDNLLDLYEVFDEEKEHWFAHQITSKLHAKKLFVIDPALIRNATASPLPPIAALAVFFADERPSFFESDYYTDPTVRELYQLAFEICEKGSLNTGMLRRSHVQKHLIRKFEELHHANDGSFKDYVDHMHYELSPMSRSPSPSLPTAEASTSAAAASTASAAPTTPAPSTSVVSSSMNNASEIVSFCNKRRQQKRTWSQIHEEGMYEKFVFENPKSLRNAFHQYKKQNQ